MYKRILGPVAVLAILFTTAWTPRPHDGRHDFDWNFGTWKTHIKRLVRPLSGAKAWVSYEGVVTVRPALGGSANVEEVEADGASHIELVNVRTYDSQSHQWSLNGASSRDGTLEQPAFGVFENGRGIFYDQEFFDERMVLMRQTFFNITPTSYSFERALSDNGGKTWEPNFVANLERVSTGAASEGSSDAAGASHDFDFNYGTWRTQITRLREGRNGGSSWTRQSGTVVVRKIWNGRASMEEINVQGAAGFKGLTLFLYDPAARQWAQTYADANDGRFEPSLTGTFYRGRGELLSQAPYRGKTALQRGVWSDITPNAHHFEIQVSTNGGRTWQPIFVAQLTRLGPGL